jgi:hypothetical protein
VRIDWAKAPIRLQGMFSLIGIMSTLCDTAQMQSASQVLPPLGVMQDVSFPSGNIHFDGAHWRVDD